MGDSKNIKLLDTLSTTDLKKKRKAIVNLEKALLKEPQTEIPLKQSLHAGVYSRAIQIPAGCMLTGAVHLYDHTEIMASGAVFITTDEGESVFLEGFNIIPAFIGKKRAFYAVEDTIWVTSHAVGYTGDLVCEEVADILTVNSFEELENHKVLLSNNDFKSFLEERGFEEDTFLKIVQNKNDMQDIDLESYELGLSDSRIQGMGLFTNKARNRGDFIAPARIKNMRTDVGRFTNHSITPNSTFIFEGEDMHMVALFDIKNNEELTVNYREVEAYRIREGDL